MFIDTMKVCRRNVFERKALRLLRGAGESGDAAEVPFADMRMLARRNGLAILPGDCPYLARCELMMLRWLAEAQRSTSLRTCHLPDRAFRASLQRCAGILLDMDVRLPAKTLYIHFSVNEGAPFTNRASGCSTSHQTAIAQPRSSPAEPWRSSQT